MIVKLYQSFYKEEQKQFLDEACEWYDNTSNTTPDLREYPQLKGIHRMREDGVDAYGLISWKFQQKALIPPVSFKNWVIANQDADAWFVNPCQILEAFCMSPWEQGEWWHPGITKLYEDTRDRMEVTRAKYMGPPKLFPKNKMFFANYVIMRPHVWQKLFTFSDRFYWTIEKHPDLLARMKAASGYATDPNMSHFIFLFERLFPTFLLENEIKTLSYPYKYEEVSSKFSPNEWRYVETLSELKSQFIDIPLGMTAENHLASAYSKYRKFVLQQVPDIITRE